MKLKSKLWKVLLIVSIAFSFKGLSQNSNSNYFQLSPRIGFDIPSFNNNTPYIDYKGGLELGVSLDYYWRWFGLGLDIDYINNKTKSIYPTDIFGIPASSIQVLESKINRSFIGLGPSFKKFNDKNSFLSELNLRVGISTINGGRTLVTGPTITDILNFHAGYDSKNVLSFKGQVRFTKFISDKMGIHFGAYYLRHLNVLESNENGLSAAYKPFETIDTETVLKQEGLKVRAEACKCDISSIGLFAGLTFKFGKREKKEIVIQKEANVCKVCGLDHYPHCCSTCNCNITVTAKDKFTGETLPNTDIVLTDLNGNILHAETSNTYGVVVFKNVKENDYLIKGKLHNITLEDNKILKKEFKNCQTESSGIQKVIEYTDENFILKGNVVECNTSIGIQGVDVSLKNTLDAGQKNTLSDNKGDFIFNLNQSSIYLISGKKDGYYSNEVEVNTKTFDRKSTLFIDFEMCVDPCGKAIKLENINFDLDKAEILSVSIPDLQKVVKLMKDNPSIIVEMSSHTDSQGSDTYNQQLSQRRANATVNYIVNQGILRTRLIARGAGESELKNSKCSNGVPCTDDEHRINRRTEFKVVCTQ